MRTADFDFALPPELIAQEPVEPRDAARLLVVERGAGVRSHRHVRDLPGLLARGDLLVLNDTRVMAARLAGVREDTGGRVELLLIRRVGEGAWASLMRPARAAVRGRRLRLEAGDGNLGAMVEGREGDLVTVAFDRNFDPATVGAVPLPPYIRDYRGDPERYQTVYAREAASAAAPTAGLHFTPALFAALEEAGIGSAFVTLEVGPGTFRPVRADDPAEHVLDAERYRIPPETAEAINVTKAAGGRVVAVGTTVVRTLEHVARLGESIAPGEGWCDLMILPGHRYRAVDALLTNFHLPRSTLLMLVAAFLGREKTLAAYDEAVRRAYRFYSFGDAMLILP